MLRAADMVKHKRSQKVNDRPPFTSLFQSHSTVEKSVYNKLCRSVETATMRIGVKPLAVTSGAGVTGKDARVCFKPFANLYLSTKHHLNLKSLHCIDVVNFMVYQRVIIGPLRSVSVRFAN